ncbi:MAG: SRPBCC family protein [Burkholderiaceae bacterium]|nr:SRPBCC family protein [Burkholderiaceae bacterium]
MTTTTASSDTDRIERSIVLNASRSRVWRALSNAEEFGDWFGVNLKDKTFAPGQCVQGQMTIKGHEDCMFDIVVERVEPEQLLSYRWHPYAMDPKIDYEKEQRTVVTFTLKDAGDGTLFTVLETGFDNVPPERRLEAFRMNSRGWEAQMGCLQRHVTPQ